MHIYMQGIARANHSNGPWNRLKAFVVPFQQGVSVGMTGCMFVCMHECMLFMCVCVCVCVCVCLGLFLGIDVCAGAVHFCARVCVCLFDWCCLQLIQSYFSAKCLPYRVHTFPVTLA